MLELDGTTGAVVAEWVYGVYIDEIVAMYRDTDPGTPGLETHYYIQDDLYNVVALTDENGSVVERYTYDDYGYPTIYDASGIALQDNESAYGNFFLFNGRRWDEELKLYDYRTRYYDPAMGRFLRIDTIGPWGDNNNLGNAYAYVGNNPWSLLDPYGLLSFEDVSLFAQDSGRVAKGFFINGPIGLVKGGVGVVYALGDNAFHPIRTGREIVGGVETIFDIATGDESGTGALIAGGVSDYVDRLDRDLETQGEALFNVSTFITGSAYVQSARTAQAANVTRVTVQAALRSRLLANLAESKAARESSKFGHFATREAHQLSLARKGVSPTIHKNSLDFVGEGHVYAIRGPKGTFKIGESTQGVRIRDGKSIRAEQQVRTLQRETGQAFESRILRNFDSKQASRDYETRLIERFRRLHGDDTLPGNRTNR